MTQLLFLLLLFISRDEGCNIYAVSSRSNIIIFKGELIGTNLDRQKYLNSTGSHRFECCLNTAEMKFDKYHDDSLKKKTQLRIMSPYSDMSHNKMKLLFYFLLHTFVFNAQN